MADISSELYKLTRYRCEKIIQYSESNPQFDSAFVMSVYSRIEDGETVTMRQALAINNIYNKFCKEH